MALAQHEQLIGIENHPRHRRCPLMALFGHPSCTDECPLSRVKRTSTNRCLPTWIYECMPLCHSCGLLVVGLEFAEPRLDTRTQVRLVAMAATEWGDVTRQAAKLCPSKSMPVSTSLPVAGPINLNGGITNPPCLGVRIREWRKRSPDGGNRGFLGSFGGTVMGGTPVTGNRYNGAAYITSNRISLCWR
jgi:hypothetical protein